MKIYTRTGDDGTTGLFGGARVQKESPRVEAYGTVDELNAGIGLARALGVDGEVEAELAAVQVELFVVGAELATVPGHETRLPMALVGAAEVTRLEAAIDAAEAPLPPLQNFILPGGTAGAAALHQARTVCRRAERRVLELAREEPVRPEVVTYLNRLSDLLFVLARRVNHAAGTPDVPWAPRQQ